MLRLDATVVVPTFTPKVLKRQRPSSVKVSYVCAYLVVPK